MIDRHIKVNWCNKDNVTRKNEFRFHMVYDSIVSHSFLKSDVKDDDKERLTLLTLNDHP